MAHRGRRLLRAVVLVRIQAPFARAARVGLPADADALAFLEAFAALHLAHDLVAGDARARVAPVAVHDVHVGMADPAVRHLDEHVVSADLLVVRERGQLRLRLQRRKRMHGHRNHLTLCEKRTDFRLLR